MSFVIMKNDIQSAYDKRRHRRIDYGNLLFCLSIMYSSVVSLFTQTLRKFIGNTGKIDTLVIYGIFFLLILKAAPYFKKRFNLRDLAVLFFLIIAFALASLRTENNSDVTTEVLKSILRNCVPAYLGAKLVQNNDKLIPYLRIAAYTMLLSVAANTYVFLSSELTTQSYSQYDGYLLLTSMALLFVPLVSEQKIYDFIGAGVTLLLTLLSGARGPFVFVTLLFLLGLYLTIRNKKYGLLFIGLFIVALVLVYFNMRTILLAIAAKFDDAGSLRTINRLLNKELTVDNSRTRIFARALEYIGSHFFYGCGVTNDRVLLQRWIPSLGEPIGCYPHNFFLEIGMQFGFILGIVVAAIFGLLLIGRYRNCASDQGKLLLIALIFAGFLPLMVSGSYLDWTIFYSLLGFCTRKDLFGGQEQNFGGLALNEQSA